jgi:hypothetical protein
MHLPPPNGGKYSLLEQDQVFIDTAQNFDSPPFLRIVFTGRQIVIPNLFLPSQVALHKADHDISVFEVEPEGQLGIRNHELYQTIQSLKGAFTEVGQFITSNMRGDFSHNSVIVTRRGDEVASYGIGYDNRKEFAYVVLPQLKDNAEGLIKVLNTLVRVYPDVFPDKSNAGWLCSEEFLTPEERHISVEIETKNEETKKFIEAKEQERKQLNGRFSFMREILVTTEDSKLEPIKRLSAVCRKCLEYLDFEVIDIDATIKSRIRKEDFWVKEGTFLAITEVSGTVAKNPKTKEFNDILSRMASIFKRKGELTPPEGFTLSGLLILNFDLQTHPNARPKPYTGEDEHLIETAKDHDISILSTVELHKIVMAVHDGKLPKKKARELIRTPGRVEFEVKEEQAAQQEEQIKK